MGARGLSSMARLRGLVYLLAFSLALLASCADSHAEVGHQQSSTQIALLERKVLHLQRENRRLRSSEAMHESVVSPTRLMANLDKLVEQQKRCPERNLICPASKPAAPAVDSALASQANRQVSLRKATNKRIQDPASFKRYGSSCWPVLLPADKRKHGFSDCGAKSACDGSRQLSPTSNEYNQIDIKTGCAWCPPETIPMIIIQDTPEARVAGARLKHHWAFVEGNPKSNLIPHVHCSRKGNGATGWRLRGTSGEKRYDAVGSAFPDWQELDSNLKLRHAPPGSPPGHAELLQLGGVRNGPVQSGHAQVVPGVETAAQWRRTKRHVRKHRRSRSIRNLTRQADGFGFSVTCFGYKIVACRNKENTKQPLRCSSSKRLAFWSIFFRNCYFGPICKTLLGGMTANTEYSIDQLDQLKQTPLVRQIKQTHATKGLCGIAGLTF